MRSLKFVLSIIVLFVLLSCSKVPFFNKEETNKKEEELSKKEQELKEKEKSLIEKQQSDLEEKKAELEKKERELVNKEKDLNAPKKIKALGSPEKIIIDFNNNISKFLDTSNDGYLRTAYKLWYNYNKSFNTFKNGYSNTLSDVGQSTNVIANDGYDATVKLYHYATELDSYGGTQTTNYESTYQLKSIDGEWKIVSGKSSISSRY